MAITMALPVAAATARLSEEPQLFVDVAMPVQSGAYAADVRPAPCLLARRLPLPPSLRPWPPSMRRRAARRSQRSPSAVMVVLGTSSLTGALRDALEKQNYNLLVYQRAEALEDVTATRLDLNRHRRRTRRHQRAGSAARRMRKRTEVPIMLVSGVGDQEKVLVPHGADEYVTRRQRRRTDGARPGRLQAPASPRSAPRAAGRQSDCRHCPA